MKTHRFDGVSFFSGLVITAIGLLYLLPDTPSDIVSAVARLGNWIWPILILAIGVAVLIPTVLPKKNKEEPEQIED